MDVEIVLENSSTFTLSIQNKQVMQWTSIIEAPQVEVIQKQWNIFCMQHVLRRPSEFSRQELKKSLPTDLEGGDRICCGHSYSKTINLLHLNSLIL